MPVLLGKCLVLNTRCACRQAWVQRPLVSACSVLCWVESVVTCMTHTVVCWVIVMHSCVYVALIGTHFLLCYKLSHTRRCVSVAISLRDGIEC